MVPLDSFNYNNEFKDLCEYVYKVTHLSSFNKKGCAYYKKGIAEVLRCFGFKFKPTRISEEAYKSIENKEDLIKNVTYKNWYNNRTNIFIFFEHIIPLGSLIDRCQKCSSENKVVEFLAELEFTIILKTENEILKKNGYEKKGRESIENALLAYENCGIQLRKIYYK